MKYHLPNMLLPFPIPFYYIILPSVFAAFLFFLVFFFVLIAVAHVFTFPLGKYTKKKDLDILISSA